MKFKNIKKKAKKTEFPSNSRTIAEGFKIHFTKLNYAKFLGIYKETLKIFVGFIFVVTVIIVGYDFQNNLKIRQGIDSQRGILTKDLYFWEDFISKHQDYRDAYFQASRLEYRLGNITKAKEYAREGLALDPNSEDGRKLEKFLVNK